VLLRLKKSGKLRTTSCAADSPASSDCGGFRISRGYLTGRSVPLSHFAANLSFLLGRPVIDETGLVGNFDLELRWLPDQATAGASLGTAATGSSADAPSIFTALQEQLGLKLKTRRGAVDVLVIDDIELPSEN
jgi:bla regulator protein blaR1